MEELEEEEEFILPTQQEYEANLTPLQNQTHADKCGSCIKTINLSGNPAANMLYCKYNGVMVSKHQSCCDRYICRKS